MKNNYMENIYKQVINICEKHRITESLNFTGINFEDEMTKFIQQKVIEARIDELDKVFELNYGDDYDNYIRERKIQLNHNKKELNE